MQVRCPNCHVPFDTVADDSWADLTCPSCEQNFSLSGGATTCTYGPGVHVLGRFELLQQVGAGKFGSVWKARDSQLQRYVAVKIPRQRDLDARETEIFLRDARAAAQLRHPNIASVHEVGRENDTVYIVSDFIDGASLSEWLTGQRLATRESVELVIKIAGALDHAHGAGVVHRDLKPGNIMLDRRGEPHVIDFGLALREVGEMTVTVEGQLLGTPAYMPPEQARGEGHRADGRSDLYSLGVILFKLLTGELPFRGEARMLIVQILDEEPPSPRKLNASVPRDLETITLKCLEKDPAKRYQTARELADDLRRWLADEPIKARPVGRLERAWRWCKRHPEVASLSAILLLVLGAVSIVAPIVAVHQARLRRESDRRGVELQNQVAYNLFQRASEEYNAGRLSQGIALLAGTYELVDSQNPLRGSIRGLIAGWSREAGRLIVHDEALLAADFTRDGRRLLIAGHNPAARLWNVETTSPLGEFIKHVASIRAVAISPNGHTAATGSQDSWARLWDIETRTAIGAELKHEGEIWCLDFSPDGQTLASGGKDNVARLWDARTGDTRGELPEHGANVLAVAFSRDSRLLVTGSADGTAQIWNVESKQPVAPPLRVGKPVYAVAFSPDGREVLTGSADRTAQFWNAETSQAIGRPLNHENSVYSVAFSADGQTIITGSHDNTARLWNRKTRSSIGQPFRHDDWVMCVRFSPDGQSAVTASGDRTARIWDIQGGIVLPHAGAAVASAFSPDGRTVVTGGEDGTAILWDALTDKPIHPHWQHPGAVRSVAFSFDGRTVVIGTGDGKLHLWNAKTGIAAGPPWELKSVAEKIIVSVDGGTALIQYANQSIQLWNLKTAAPIAAPLPLPDPEALLATSPDGHTALVCESSREARLWDTRSNEARGDVLRHDAKIWAAEFSADGRLVATVGQDQRVRLWDSGKGKQHKEPMLHGGIVKALAIGRSGRLVISGSSDRTARLWNVETCMPVGQPMRHPNEVREVALSPDSRLALAVCTDGSALLWDTESCKLVARPLQYGISRREKADDESLFKVVDGEFNSDGTVILFTCSDGTARLYEVPQPLPDNPNLIRVWSRARSGFQLDEKSMPRRLSQAEWLKVQKELELLQKRN